MLWPSKFPAARHVVDLGEQARILGAERRLDLGERPHIELALLALAVGIERRGEAAGVDHHLAQQPGDRLLDALRVERRLGLAPRLGHQVDELRVVVQHLLEMRHQPALVDAVAREAAAEMIVDAALGDVSQRELDRRERIGETEAQARRATADSRTALAEISARP